MTQVVQPNDSNPLGSLHGGTLLYWMDECSAIAATKLSRAVVVTVSVDGVSFKNAIDVGDIVPAHVAVVGDALERRRRRAAGIDDDGERRRQITHDSPRRRLGGELVGSVGQ